MNPIVNQRRRHKAEVIRAIRCEFQKRYEEEVRAAGWWRRLAIALRVEREVRKEVKRRFPPAALYSSSIAR